jgi:hypothetical protein
MLGIHAPSLPSRHLSDNSFFPLASPATMLRPLMELAEQAIEGACAARASSQPSPGVEKASTSNDRVLGCAVAGGCAQVPVNPSLGVDSAL